MREQKNVRTTKISQRDRVGEYLADVVYGANDGIITTFVVVSGAIGASLPTGVIVILGMTNLIADGYSMGVSSYLSNISEKRLLSRKRKEKKRFIEEYPEHCKEEVQNVFHKLGLPHEEAARLSQHVTQNKDAWLAFLLQQENGKGDGGHHAVRHGAATFTAFIIAGAIPLLPFIFGFTEAVSSFTLSVISTAIALSIVGVIRTVVTETGWLRNIAEMLLIGGTAAGLAYSAGYILATTFGIAM